MATDKQISASSFPSVLSPVLRALWQGWTIQKLLYFINKSQCEYSFVLCPRYIRCSEEILSAAVAAIVSQKVICVTRRVSPLCFGLLIFKSYSRCALVVHAANQLPDCQVILHHFNQICFYCLAHDLCITCNAFVVYKIAIMDMTCTQDCCQTFDWQGCRINKTHKKRGDTDTKKKKTGEEALMSTTVARHLRNKAAQQRQNALGTEQSGETQTMLQCMWPKKLRAMPT